MLNQNQKTKYRKIRVKIIEDGPDNLRALTKMVNSLGFKAEPTLITNKTSLDSVPPPVTGLVLLDQNLPGSWQGHDWLNYYKKALNKVVVASISNTESLIGLKHFPNKHGLVLKKPQVQADFKRFLDSLASDWHKK